MRDHKEGRLSGWLRRRRFNAALPHVTGKVADVGCGIGRFAQHVSPDRYLGIDVNERALDVARQSFPNHRFVSVEEIGVLDPESFDTVTCLAVIEHLKDPGLVLGEAYRLIRPSGAMVITTPHPSLEFVHTIGSRLGLFSREAENEHETLFHKSELERMLRDARFKPTHYSRFLLGGNQLIVALKS
jgi:2-polyprenyl-3-methyl-5-hydroxy-6-metoxy-1,4-benzoquinol methylase